MNKIMTYAGWVVAFIGLVGIIILLLRKPVEKPLPVGQVLIAQSTLDSLYAIPKPDTIIKDTTIYSTVTTVVHDSIPYAVEDTSGVRSYSKVVKNDSIDVEVESIVVGELIDQTIAYKPIIHNKTVTIGEPYAVSVNVPVETPKTHFYLGGAFGGNFNKGLGGASAEVIDRGGRSYEVIALTDTKDLFILGTFKFRAW